MVMVRPVDLLEAEAEAEAEGAEAFEEVLAWLCTVGPPPSMSPEPDKVRNLDRGGGLLFAGRGPRVSLLSSSSVKVSTLGADSDRSRWFPLESTLSISSARNGWGLAEVRRSNAGRSSTGGESRRPSLLPENRSAALRV